MAEHHWVVEVYVDIDGIWHWELDDKNRDGYGIDHYNPVWCPPFGKHKTREKAIQAARGRAWDIENYEAEEVRQTALRASHDYQRETIEL